MQELDLDLVLGRDLGRGLCWWFKSWRPFGRNLGRGCFTVKVFGGNPTEIWILGLS